MYQDNGNITAYCTVHNHENVLVNIPELIQAALGGNEELQTDEEKIRVAISSTTEGETTVNIEHAGPVSIPAGQQETPDELPITPTKPKAGKKPKPAFVLNRP